VIDIHPQFLVDVFDILVVAFLFYRLFAMIKGRARPRCSSGSCSS
jgi:hypothetical protein